MTYSRKFAAALAASVCVVAIAAPAQAQVRQFNIGAGSLKSALDAWARQSGRQVIYKSDEVRGAKSRGVHGALSADDALQALLAGSGFAARGDASGALAIVRSARAEGNEGAGGAEAPSSGGQEIAGNAGAISEILVVGQRSLNTDIRRTEDDAQPYVVFDSKEIQRSGAQDVDAFLRSRLPMNATSSLQVSDAQYTPPSGSPLVNDGSLNLRGLGASETLVLVDGRRLPSVNTIGGFAGQPHITGIPVNAIERIEVLPSTASGIYGGSATGGVVNIILKHNYTGLELGVEYDNTFKWDTQRVRFDANGGLSFGNEHRTQLGFSASHTRGNPLYVTDRPFAKQARARLLQNDPSALLSAPPSSAYTNFCASSSCSSAILTLPSGASYGSALGHVPAGYAGPQGDGGAGLTAGAGSFDLTIPDFRQSLLNTPDADALNLTARHQITSGIEAYANFNIDRTISNYFLGGRALSGGTFQPAQSPFQQAIQYSIPLYGLTYRSTAKTTNLNAVGGFIVKLPHRWSATAEHSWARSITDASTEDHPLTNAQSFALLTSGQAYQDLLAHPIDLSSIAARVASRHATSTLNHNTFRASGPLLSMPGGPITWTVSLEQRKEVFDRDVYSNPTGSTGLNYILDPERTQTVKSAYIEARAPILSPANGVPLFNTLEIAGSVRYDHYETVSTRDHPLAASSDGPFAPATYATGRFHSTDYLLGLRYSPVSGILLRASTGTGFVPPSLIDLNSVTSTFPAFAFFAGDPRRGNTAVVGDANGNIPFISGGNPDLKPSTSKSLSYGAVFEPEFAKGLRLSIDYTRIKKKNEIVFLSPSTVLLLEGELPGRVTRGPNLPGDPSGYAGPIVSIDATEANFNRSLVSSFDIQASYDFTLTGIGKFSVYSVASRMTHFMRQVSANGVFTDYLGYADGPLKWRGNIGANWETGQWTIGWNAQYFDSYKVNATFDSASRVATEIKRQGSTHIPHQIYNDLTVGYRFPKGAGPALSGLQLDLGIQNVFNQQPPIIAGGPNFFTTAYSGYGDPRLRRFTLQLRRSF